MTYFTMAKPLCKYLLILFALLRLSFSLTSNLNASTALRTIFENMHCVNIPIFTVTLMIWCRLFNRYNTKGEGSTNLVHTKAAVLDLECVEVTAQT